jgi:tellurite resistance protein TerC
MARSEVGLGVGTTKGGEMLDPRTGDSTTAVDGVLRHARRVVVSIVGGTVVGVGVALVVLPGPAFLVIPAGLAILGTEFLWARRLLTRAKNSIRRGAAPPR